MGSVVLAVSGVLEVWLQLLLVQEEVVWPVLSEEPVPWEEPEGLQEEEKGAPWEELSVEQSAAASAVEERLAELSVMPLVEP